MTDTPDAPDTTAADAPVAEPVRYFLFDDRDVYAGEVDRGADEPAPTMSTLVAPKTPAKVGGFRWDGGAWRSWTAPKAADYVPTPDPVVPAAEA